MKLAIRNHTWKFAGSKQQHIDPKYMEKWFLDEITVDYSKCNMLITFPR